MTVIGQSARMLAAEMSAGRLSAVEVMRATLARIEAVNGGVNAIISLRDREALMGEARLSDTMRRATGPSGWMHGLPVAVKELVPVKGLPFTEGSPIHAARIATEDGAIVRRMKAAGAIVIGKTNVPQFGLGSHSVNPVFGATRNPFDPARTAGGSSGGAAVALATGMVPLADGSDMMGSLRNPSAWNDVYGFRPTVGRITSDPGDAVLAHRLSTLGPMARDPGDLAAFFATLAGEAVPDPLPPPRRTPRIGWLGDWGGAHATEPGILDLAEAALARMEALGWSVEPVAPPLPADQLWDSWTALRSFVVAQEHGAHLNDPARRDLLNPQTRWEIERGLALTGADVAAAAAARVTWLRRAEALFTRFDALVLPATQVWPFPVETDWPREIAGRGLDSYHRWMEGMVPASLAGLPVAALPAGFGPEGLPGGVQLIGAAGRDWPLLSLAARYAEAIGPRTLRTPS